MTDVDARDETTAELPDADDPDVERGDAVAAVEDATDVHEVLPLPDTLDASDVAPTDDDARDGDALGDTREIDPEGDSDRDGVRDLEELSDGTDPFDPRSCRGWHPEVDGHPRLFTRPELRSVVSARAAATDGVGRSLWLRVLEHAGRAVPAHPVDQTYDTTIPPVQAQIAEAAALVGYALGDLEMTRKALETLAAPFPDPSPLNERSLFNAGDHYDLHEAEALQGFCSAYDLAAGTAGAEPGAIAAARGRLIERIDLFRDLCMTRGGCTTLLRAEPNNHSIKALAALGTCAIAIADRPEAAVDFNEALSAIAWLAHERQGNAEGGWAESWNYLAYSGETHLGFLYAAHHTADLAGAAQGWSVRGEGWITRRNERNGQVVVVPVPGRDPIWRAVYDKALFAMMPSGASPPVDDANPSAQHWGLLSALFDDARFLWAWDLPATRMHTGRQLIATFLALEPGRSAITPSWDTDGFFAAAGFSVLRTSLDPDTTYLHVQHELEDMRLGGGSHEHADPLSFMLVAFGEYLAIDPGYIDFSNHAKVKYGKDHNIVLVDGTGPEFFLDGLVDSPPNSDAYLHSHEVRAPFATLIASTKYAGAELRRRVVRVGLPGQDVFVIADDLIGPGARLWTYQLNGLAGEEIGGTSFGFTASDGGAVATWTRPRATLFASVAATQGSPVPASRLEESALASGRHRCFTLEAQMGDGGGFVSMLVPARSGVTPTMETARSANGLTTVTASLEGGVRVDAWLNLGDVPLSASAQGVELRVDPGLTVAVIASDGEVTTGAWSMETPDIPDPEPFLP